MGLRPALLAARQRYRFLVRPRVITNRGIRLPVGPPLTRRMCDILYTGDYENDEYAIVHKHLASDARVLELGTGLGFITTLCALICGSGNVFSYEANPDMIPVAEKVFALNRVRPRLQQALVNRDGGTVNLRVTDSFWSSSVHDREGVRDVMPCRALRFRDVLAEARPNFLLVDIEGGEHDLVGETLPVCVRQLLIELHAPVIGADKVDHVRRWIEGEGFSAVEDHGDNAPVYYERA
jgi:FkbM family methyltransferase